MNIGALLAKAAQTHPARPALVRGVEVTADYAAFHARAGAIGGGLRASFGLMPGARVGIAMKNRPEYLEALFGIWYAGLVAVPINAKLHAKEFAYILENSGAELCFTSPDLTPTIEALIDGVVPLGHVIEADGRAYRSLLSGTPMPPADAEPEAPAWLFYTSGTTGRPKGATLTHRNLLVMVLSFFADLETISPGDSAIHGAPLSHGSGLYALPHVAKAAANVIPNSGGFDAAEIIDLIRLHHGVMIFAAPTMVVRMMNSPAAGQADTRNLKMLCYGGAPMYVADVERALALFGPKLVQLYGQGEAPMTVSYLSKADHMDKAHPDYGARIGSTGIARTDVEIRIADENDVPLPAGEVGEVLARGDVVMAGYWQDPDASARTLRGGWLHTGDVGRLDHAGYLTLMDRSKDMIISGGTNIYPREIEEVLLQDPSVSEVSVVGAPHADWGEAVVAFVVAAEGAEIDTSALDARCLDQIARFKRPRDYRIVSHLPKNNYGKVLKRELRAQLAQESETSSA